MRQPLTWAYYLVESAVEAVDKLSGSGKSDVKTSHQFLNGKVSQSEKFKVGHFLKLKELSDKGLWLHQDPRRVRRRRTPMVWL